MKYLEKVRYFYIFLILLLFSCSVKNNRFPNRAYRYIVLKYNVMFNAFEAMEKAEKIMEKEYKEDFYKILPVYPISLLDSSHTENDELLKAVEKKAMKGIHRHSMFIDNKERNRYIDRAYLLLGKSMFYQQDFEHAVETFSYAKSNFKGFEEWLNCCIWLERASIKIGRHKSGYDFLKDILKTNTDLKKKEKREIYKILVQASISAKNFDNAEKDITTLISLTKNERERHRYIFILGQIQRKKGDIINSNTNFRKLIEEDAEKEFFIMSKIFISENLASSKSGNYREIVAPLFSLMEDDENSSYQNKIFFQISNIYFREGMLDSSLYYIEKSISKSKEMGLNVDAGHGYYLAEKIHFEKGDYVNSIYSCEEAMKYLLKYSEKDKDDTVMPELKSRKRKLSLITRYIKSYEEKNEIISLNELPEDSLKKILYSQVNEKYEHELLEKQRKIEKQKTSNTNNWYFYDDNILKMGMEKFKTKWGNRELVDNWRLNYVEKIEVINPKSNVNGVESRDSSINKEVELLMSETHFGQDSLEKIISQRNYEYYTVAILYRDQFKRNDLCIKQLKKLLDLKPSDDLLPPSYYFLHKSYLDLGRYDSAQYYKDIILKDYGDSKYSLLLKENTHDKSDITSQKLHREIYTSYKNKDFSKTRRLVSNFIDYFPNDPLLSKVYLINAMTYSNNNYDKYREELKYIMFNFPGSKESIECLILLDNLDNYIEKNKGSITSQPQFIIILHNSEDYEKSIEKIDSLLPDTEHYLSSEGETEFITIREFKTAQHADEESAILIEKYPLLFKKNNIFVLSSSVYEGLVKNNSLLEHLKERYEK